MGYDEMGELPVRHSLYDNNSLKYAASSTDAAGQGRKALILGISGASSSGKTTLSRLLRDIFPNTFILHEDDFYKEEKAIPVTDGILDWDCAEALSVPDIIETLNYIQENGIFPPHFDSKEDRNEIGECSIPEAVIVNLKAEVAQWTQPGNSGYGILAGSKNPFRLCIFDGFLLYSQSMVSVQQHMDIKLFLRVSYAKVKARREARSGYATIEGFWEDPPRYVDKIVWPNYARDHKWIFEDGNVEGKLNEDVVRELGILSQSDRDIDIDMETTLKWAVATVTKELELLYVKHKGGLKPKE